MGVVIGRSGEMIKKIQNDAGVRIQFKQGQGLAGICLDALLGSKVGSLAMELASAVPHYSKTCRTCLVPALEQLCKKVNDRQASQVEEGCVFLSCQAVLSLSPLTGSPDRPPGPLGEVSS